MRTSKVICIELSLRDLEALDRLVTCAAAVTSPLRDRAPARTPSQARFAGLLSRATY